MIPEKIKGLMQKLIDNRFEAYVIGGAVRDTIMGIEPHDWDIFTNATGEQILDIFPKGVVMGSDERQAKILTVIVEGTEISQYRANGARTETGSNLKDHIMTCDFTVNALCMNINEEIIDYVNGKNDIVYKVVRFVGNPLDRMKEDPLRILRGIRFWETFGKFEDIQIVLDNLDLLDTIPRERIREEFMKILSTKTGLQNLWCDGIINKISSHFKSVRGLDGGDKHNELVDQHMIDCAKLCGELTSNNLLKFACYIHDIGKGVTRDEDENGVSFIEHEKIGRDIVEEIMNDLKFSKDDIKYVTTLVYRHMFGYMKNVNEKGYITLFKELDESKIRIMDYVTMIYCDTQSNRKNEKVSFLDFCEKDNIGNILDVYYKLKYDKNKPFSEIDLDIGGKEVIEVCNVSQGKEVGEILTEVFDKVNDGKLENSRPVLMNYLRTRNKRELK